MKKTAIALAVSAAVFSTAQAQNIVIDGYFDRGFTNTNSTDNRRDIQTFASSAGTSFIGFSGSEDLGGGLRASFRINTEFNDLGGANTDRAAVDSTSALSGNAVAGLFANSVAWLQIGSTALGDLRFGTINNETLTAVTAVANPSLSTGVGSNYSTAFSVHAGAGTGTSGQAGLIQQPAWTNTTAAYGGARMIRQASSVYYYSPTVAGGFRFAAGYVPQNDKGSTADTVGVTEYSLRYTSGPIDVMFAELKYDVPTTNVPGGSAATQTQNLTASSAYTNRTLGARYNITPSLRLHGGYYTSKSTGLTTDFNQTAQSLGVSYSLTPSVILMAQAARANDKSTNNMDRSVSGIGLDYNLSKRTRAYFRYDTITTDKDLKATSGNQLERTAVGISHSF